MRVVLDTNVLLSALLYGQRLEFIAQALRDGAITPCFSNATFSEIERTLRYPKFKQAIVENGTSAEDVLAMLASASLLYPDTPSPVTVTADRTDEPFLACALGASAAYLVTGDKHLLALAGKFPISILRPSEFKKIICG